MGAANKQPTLGDCKTQCEGMLKCRYGTYKPVTQECWLSEHTATVPAKCADGTICQSFDMVVCVSPATGSFMGWRVEKIDVAYPFQALTTRFVLKLPWLVLDFSIFSKLCWSYNDSQSQRLRPTWIGKSPVCRDVVCNLKPKLMSYVTCELCYNYAIVVLNLVRSRYHE